MSHTSRDSVFRAAERAVEWGRAHRNLGAIRSIGIDEIAWSCGHRYLTLVYRIDSHRKRRLWTGRERKIETLPDFDFRRRDFIALLFPYVNTES